MVVFTTQDGQSLVIGGQSGVGPYPKYSITRTDNILQAEGVILSSRYSIVITGTVAIDSSIDPTDSGALQSEYNEQIKNKINLIRNKKNVTGRLEINPYGGKPGKLIYNDCKMTSVSVPEASDESMGLLFFDYTFNFEASIDASVGLSPDYNNFFLSSMEESWTIDNSGDYSYELDDITSNPTKNFTITHSLNAVGLRKPLPGGGFDKSAWFEAQKWVNSRLVNDPFTVILKDLIGEDNFTSFTARYFGNVPNISHINLDNYIAFNHTRIPNVSLSEGSYGVNETWQVSKSKASVDLEVSIDVDQNEFVTVNLSGTVTGFNSDPYSSIYNKSLDNAETVYETIDQDSFEVCNFYYNKLNTGFSLQDVVQQKTIGRNKNNGTISFSFVYNDKPLLVNNSISASLTSSFDNDLHRTKIIAIIPVIAKPNGPVIQDMNTSKERRKSTQLDVIMKRQYRNSKPEEAANLLLSKAPSQNTTKLVNFNENWDEITGAYSATAEWVY